MSAIRKADSGENVPSRRLASTNSSEPPYTTVPMSMGIHTGSPSDCT